MEFLEFDGCFNFNMVIGQEVTRTVFNDKNFRNFVDYRSIFRLVWKIQIKPRCSIARLNFPPCFINLDLETTANRCYFPSRNNISLFVIAGSFFSLFFFSFFILIFSFNSFSKLAIHTLDNFPASREYTVILNVYPIKHANKIYLRVQSRCHRQRFRTRVPGSIF